MGTDPVIRLDLGGFLAADEEGWLLGPARERPLQERWLPALEALASACRREVGASFHSFYVRGSVAGGTAVAGSSDLDTVLVLDDDEGERRPAWQQALGARVVEVHPFVVDVEVVALGRGALLAAAADRAGADPVVAEWCFLLATGARCLAGVDLLGELGRFRPGPEVAFVLRALPPALRRFEARLERLGDLPPGGARDEEGRRLCTWTCKRLLRAGAELAMLEDGRYTRDLGPCVLQLEWRLPRFAALARQLLLWALRPPADLTGLVAAVEELEPVLVGEACAAGLVLEEVPPGARA